MDTKEYVIRQLAKTKNKRYEAYVVTRIVHLLNDFTLKFVTQQYVVRPEGRALTDLFFPQLGLHIEVDEAHHTSKENSVKDAIREADIINATGHTFLRIDVTQEFDVINKRIDQVIEHIKALKADLSSFVAWDINVEFNPQTYIDRGYIDIADDVAFKTIKDACNCFGHQYIGYQSAGASHPHQKDHMLWFPKLYPNGDWDNQISTDEEIIYERHVDEEKANTHVSTHLSNPEKHKHKRIVFAKVKGSLGDVLYRFRGMYELDTANSNVQIGLIWKRVATQVTTYSHGDMDSAS